MPTYRLLGREFSARGLREYLAENIARYGEETDKWITIGGHEEGRKKHAGGTPVKVGAGGKIEQGPPALEGKSLEEISKPIADEQEATKPTVSHGKPLHPGQPEIPEMYTLTPEQEAAQEASPLWKNLKQQVAGIPPVGSVGAPTLEDRRYLNWACRAYFAGKLSEDQLKDAMAPYYTWLDSDKAFGALFIPEDDTAGEAAEQVVKLNHKWALKNSDTAKEFLAQLDNLGWSINEPVPFKVTAMQKYKHDGDLLALYKEMANKGAHADFADFFEKAWKETGLDEQTLAELHKQAKGASDGKVYMAGSNGHWTFSDSAIAKKVVEAMSWAVAEWTENDKEKDDADERARVRGLLQELEQDGDITHALRELTKIDGNPVNSITFIKAAREAGIDDDTIGEITGNIGMPKEKLKVLPHLKAVLPKITEAVDSGNYIYGSEHAVKKFSQDGNVSNLMSQLKIGGGTTADKVMDILNEAGIEIPPMQGWGGQYELPGMLPHDSSDKKPDFEGGLTESQAETLANFIAKHSPQSTAGGSEATGSSWAGADTFKTPSGEEFQLYDSSEESSFPHASDTPGEDISKSSQQFLDSIPKKMGWDDITTKEWEKLAELKHDWSDLETQEQEARDEYHAEQEAEQEQEDEESSGSEWFGEVTSSSFSDKPDSYNTTANWAKPSDGDFNTDTVRHIDQSHWREVLEQSEFKLNPWFDSGRGSSDEADSFWDYAAGNLGSLNSDQKYHKEKVSSTLYDAVDTLIDEVGVWKHPMTVFRAAYSTAAHKEKFMQGVNRAIKNNGTFYETTYGHTSPNMKQSTNFHGNGGVLLVIKSKTGAWIAPYTQHSHENEILKARRTRYKPLQVYDTEINGYTTTVVDCEEVLPDEIVAERQRRNDERKARKGEDAERWTPASTAT